MATITFTVASGVLNGSRVFTLSDADVTRWINAAKVAWPPKNAQGNPLPNPTNAQALASWADELMGRTKRIVKDVEGKTGGPAEISIVGS